MLQKVSWLLVWLIAVDLLRKLPVSDPDYEFAVHLAIIGSVVATIDLLSNIITWGLNGYNTGVKRTD